MDRIDSFVIFGKGCRDGTVEFTLVISEEDIPEEERENIIDYIEHLVHELKKNIPLLVFTWCEAHKIKPNDIYPEILHQVLIQRRFN